MAWKIEFEPAAQRELDKLDKSVARIAFESFCTVGSKNWTTPEKSDRTFEALSANSGNIALATTD
jgi:mRNA-degrading endonuclease RelE of RelBE toxin-antitoxin system